MPGAFGISALPWLIFGRSVCLWDLHGLGAAITSRRRHVLSAPAILENQGPRVLREGDTYASFRRLSAWKLSRSYHPITNNGGADFRHYTAFRGAEHAGDHIVKV